MLSATLKKIIMGKNRFDIFVFFATFLFSWWLMWHTFDYKNGHMLIATKAWSDFSANIPLIRSFSFGKNFPPEYPLFPGEPIKYHFLFYFIVGSLEKIGLPLSWSLNLPSLLGFWGLLCIIYLLAKNLFKSSWAATLSVILFLFNGSLSFLEFFKKHPLSTNTISQIAKNTVFPSFGPYDGKEISAFWNLNIYTNQRHLAAAYFITIFIIYRFVVNKKRKVSNREAILLGVIFGMTPYFHKVAFVMIGVVLCCLFLLIKKIRIPLIITFISAAILAIPQLIYQTKGGMPIFSFHPGYLTERPLTIMKFLEYWFLNLGLSLLLIPTGFFISGKMAKKVFIAFVPLFVIGNLFQFSPEMAANHKFFNLFLIIGNMYTAYLLTTIWGKNIFGKLLAPTLLFLLVFSGVIDFFPVKNDPLGELADYPVNPEVNWIIKNTPPESIFLNSSFLYHPANLAGRKIFFGWPYFSWSLGYSMNDRGNTYKKIYEIKDKKKMCDLLTKNKIDYFDTRNTKGNLDLPSIDLEFFSGNFKYTYSRNGYTIYKTSENCQM